jgi:hypothetical protein
LCRGDYVNGSSGRHEPASERLVLIDVKLAQGAAMFFTLVIAKLIPQIMDFSIWWFIGLAVICTIKPFYVFWFEK